MTPISIPSNVAAVGIVIGRSHRDVVSEVIGNLKNKEMIALLSLFRTEGFQYVVVAGDPIRGGVVGGCAVAWGHAKGIFSIVKARLDDLARDDFTSVWLLFIEPHEIDQLNDLVAFGQLTRGNA